MLNSNRKKRRVLHFKNSTTRAISKSRVREKLSGKLHFYNGDVSDIENNEFLKDFDNALRSYYKYRVPANNQEMLPLVVKYGDGLDGCHKHKRPFVYILNSDDTIDETAEVNWLLKESPEYIYLNANFLMSGYASQDGSDLVYNPSKQISRHHLPGSYSIDSALNLSDLVLSSYTKRFYEYNTRSFKKTSSFNLDDAIHTRNSLFS